MYTKSLRNIRKGKVRKWLKVSQGVFCIFSKHVLHVSVCLTVFQALLIPPLLFFSCLLDSYVFGLKHRLWLNGCLFGYKIQLVPKHGIAL